VDLGDGIGRRSRGAKSTSPDPPSRAKIAGQLRQPQHDPILAKTTNSNMVGRSGVAEYRLYFLDAANRIAAREEFEADDDETAITIARQRYNVRPDFSSGLELWRGERRLVPEQDGGSANQTVA
jgi:hypothetical protein